MIPVKTCNRDVQMPVIFSGHGSPMLAPDLHDRFCLQTVSMLKSPVPFLSLSGQYVTLSYTDFSGFRDFPVFCHNKMI